MIKKLLITFVCLFAFSSCGFEPLNQIERNNYFVNNINSQGERRIGYFLKEKILLNSKSDAKNKFNINLKTKKIKEIKEKKISGKISSYRISLNVDLLIKNIDTQKEISKNFTRSDSYNVANNHSDTLSNEKKATEKLTETISDDIINFFIIYLNR
ncbi:MAG: hypothetical protein CBE47_01920 [Pelagibacteraceae bacterium TMED287]|nr:MAG: hypothetical protein CBE47_01920 [Pelagibacteraceae bacterium TMED287]|tara:strand:+ start:433 stop:900 length:468 start_codon:yes stop_codon:yes gene_type:complete